MSRFRFVALLLVLIFAVSPLAVFAQDGTGDVEVYEFEDGSLTFEYPAGWLITEDDESPFPAVAVVNNEDALARMDNGETQVSGDAVFLIMALPTDLFQFVGEAFPVDADADDQAEFVVEMLFADEEAEEEGALEVEIGALDDFELENGLVVGTAELSGEEEDGIFATFLPSEGVLMIVYAAAFSGEFTEEQADQGMALLESLEYTGTADELMMLLMGAPAEELSEEDMDGESTEALDGEALVEARCSTCHTTERIYNADKDQAGWVDTVDRMIGYGAALDDAERDAVIEYLAGLE